ncbi:MAG: Mrp/NBP35 family ATP-binding protein [Proteobacteria bacterium]|jgi:ATP-binding protein involved in chromosome partitioning|nr:Mrp/NBP35 family ATP-binding protein [Pseudomonadota bacterium]
MSEIDAKAIVEAAARQVRDSITGRSIWLAEMARLGEVEGDVLRFEVVFEEGHQPVQRQMVLEQMAMKLKENGWTGRIEARVLGPPQEQTPGPAKAQKPKIDSNAQQRIPGVGHVVAVASAKGGVGKSTIAVNLAVALGRAGYTVGLLDLDVYGPSIPTMLNITSRPQIDEEQKVIPVDVHGVRAMSMGLLIPRGEAVIWRGPMVMGALRQFVQDVRWEGCDYLIVDLPPGTGDALLSFIQSVVISGVVLVTTPQKVALEDAVRGMEMFRRLEVPLVGLVQNMAYYALPDGTRDYVFGEEGGRRVAEAAGTEVIADIPLQTTLRESCDAGVPAALGDGALAGSFTELAARVAQKLPVASS